MRVLVLRLEVVDRKPRKDGMARLPIRFEPGRRVGQRSVPVGLP
jgi:hypothetical protein